MSAPLFLCLDVRDFAAQTLARLRTEFRKRPLAILTGDSPLESVFGLNQQARSLGLELGMGRLQAESFEGVSVCPRVKQSEDSDFHLLMKSAERFSPRIEILASPTESATGATLILDISSSERLFGSPERIASAIRHEVETTGFEPSIATSCNAYAAVLVARGMHRTTVIPPKYEAKMLASFPLAVMDLEPEQQETFSSWGIRTLGELAALPQKALIARIGQSGHRLQALARGEYQHMLVPVETSPYAALSENAELEHPVDLLEPLLFLLSRMLEQIVARAAERALAIASVEIKLILDCAMRREHRRVVRPALPESNHQTLLKLVQLDLETHPPEAAVIALYVQAQPARPQTVQQGLFAAQTPEAGRLEVLLARLRKLVGEDRVGAPELLDSHRPDAFRMAPFLPLANARASVAPNIPSPALRMLRPPRTLHVEMRDSRLIALFLDGQKLPVQEASGPWKASGAWWTLSEWCREEWDVGLGEQERLCCRVAYDPGARSWYLTGIYD